MIHKIISVVDDDDRVLQSLAGLLVSFGYEVRPHLSGEGFLSSGDVHTIDCLVSDIGMPGMNGIELLAKVLLERPALPVILITGCPEKYWAQMALKNGARYFFDKPLDIAKFMEAIQFVL